LDTLFLTLPQVGGPNFKITDKAIRALRDCDWPGNIRELRNTIERAVIAARRRKSSEIGYEDVAVLYASEDLAQRTRKIEASLPRDVSELSAHHYSEFLKDLEREYLRTALELVKGNATDLATKLGLARSTAFKKLKDLNVAENAPTLSQRIGKSLLMSSRARFAANHPDLL
jgi:two-component system nitrogen regulation response regulator NtrX